MLMLVSLSMSLAAQAGEPSRKAQKGCTWERLSDKKLGLEAWVQRCDFGYRKVDLFVSGNAVVQRFSDGGKPEPVIDVFGLKRGETPETGLRRIFAEHTDARLAKRCVLKPFHDSAIAPRKDVKRYVFAPDAAYAKELKAKEVPGDLPDPPCGEWGESADSIGYFEAQPKTGVLKVMYVDYGQDEPLRTETQHESSHVSLKQGETMKGMEQKKSDKKKPQKTLMEKRAEKQAKKKNR
jgi:hypothetical protein